MTQKTAVSATLLARLRIIAGMGHVGGMTTGGYLGRADADLITRGLVERRGDRLVLTTLGAQVVEVDEPLHDPRGYRVEDGEVVRCAKCEAAVRRQKEADDG